MKRFVLALALIVFSAVGLYAQADAGFLEHNGRLTNWYCKHQDGSFWIFTPYNPDEGYTYADAVAWCTANGYSWPR